MKYALVSIVVALFFPCLIAQSDSVRSKSDCSKIKSTYDKFDSIARSSSPILDPISFVKTVKQKDTSYMLVFVYMESSSDYLRRGVTLLLSNGRKLNWPDAIVDCKYTSYYENYRYLGFVTLTSGELDLLLKNRITDIKSESYIKEILEMDGNNYKNYLNCLFYDF